MFKGQAGCSCGNSSPQDHNAHEWDIEGHEHCPAVRCNEHNREGEDVKGEGRSTLRGKLAGMKGPHHLKKDTVEQLPPTAAAASSCQAQHGAARGTTGEAKEHTFIAWLIDGDPIVKSVGAFPVSRTSCAILPAVDFVLLCADTFM